MGYIVVGAVVELSGARAYGPRPSDPQYPAAWSFSHALRRDDDTGFARPDRSAGDRATGCPASGAARAPALDRRAHAHLGHPRGERGPGRPAQPWGTGAAAGVR